MSKQRLFIYYTHLPDFKNKGAKKQTDSLFVKTKERATGIVAKRYREWYGRSNIEKAVWYDGQGEAHTIHEEEIKQTIKNKNPVNEERKRDWVRRIIKPVT